MDVETPVREGFTAVAAFVPKLLGFLVILLVGYVVAKVVASLVDKALERTGFDRAVERGGVKKALDNSQYDASDLVAKLAFFAVFIPFLSAAVGALGIQALQEPLAAFIALIPRIIVAIVLVVLGAVIAGAVKSWISSALGGLSYGTLLGNGAAVLVVFGFLKSALDQVGIATAVTGPVLYAFLGTIAGVIIVGVGGGLIRPMQRRWEDWLDRAGDESRKIQDEARSHAPSNAPSDEPAYPADPAAPPTVALPTTADSTATAPTTSPAQRPVP